MPPEFCMRSRRDAYPDNLGCTLQREQNSGTAQFNITASMRCAAIRQLTELCPNPGKDPGRASRLRLKEWQYGNTF